MLVVTRTRWVWEPHEDFPFWVTDWPAKIETKETIMGVRKREKDPGIN